MMSNLPYRISRKLTVNLDYWQVEEIVKSHYGVSYQYLAANESPNDSTDAIELQYIPEGEEHPAWQMGWRGDLEVDGETEVADILEDLLNSGYFQGVEPGERISFIVNVCW
jgi:hypothetical protein